ncbi:hypothetical protein ACFPOU_07655 [Massilia jejuensis]|uniref:Uncharacterized protein n=1 Tax=Massilia jejuensis TaxID=648894 RepID=A0ABW0PGA5_9BURK
MTTTSNETAAAGANPSVSRFSVELIIRAFRVTATNRLIASSYAASDAREFLASWNYTVGRVCPAAADELTLTATTLPIAIHVQKDPVPDGGRDRLYTCDASYTVVVDATDRYPAGEAALRLVSEPSRIPAQLASYRDQAFWAKLMPVARPTFERMAEVLRRRGFDAKVRASSASDAQAFLAIDVEADGEQIGTLALVKHVAGPTDAERPALSPCLHFVGAHDVEASSTPGDHPDVWLNDAQVSAGDIACLDIDAFDSFFDLVLDQRDEARATAAPAAYA